MSGTYPQYVCKHSAMSQRSTLKRLHKVQIVTISVKIWLSSLKSHMHIFTMSLATVYRF
jgi:hypothetical protein